MVRGILIRSVCFSFVNKSLAYCGWHDVKTTTKDLFDECLHKYTIVDVIKDENVLKFAIEYVCRYKQVDSANEMDTPTKSRCVKILSPQWKKHQVYCNVKR